MFSLQRWTTALCRSDYDGDGKTNGEELGDPFCIWEKGKYFVHDFTVCYQVECGPDLRNQYLKLSLGGRWAMKRALALGWAGVQLACAWDPSKQTNQMHNTLYTFRGKLPQIAKTQLVSQPTNAQYLYYFCEHR